MRLSWEQSTMPVACYLEYFWIQDTELSCLHYSCISIYCVQTT